MSQTKITIIGKLRFSEEKGLEYSLPFGKPPGKQMTAWLEAGQENAHDWPGLGKYPEYPEEKTAPSILHNHEAYQRWAAAKKQAEDDWRSASTEYDQKLNADPAYRRGQDEMIETQPAATRTLPTFFCLFFGATPPH